MPRPRFQKLDPALQQHILEIAAAEFAAGGFHGASYNQIIAASGVSKGSFYYYFDDKEDLFLTVLEREYSRLWEGARGLWIGEVGEEPFWEQVEAMLRQLLHLSLSSPRAMQLTKAALPLWESARDSERLQAFMTAIATRTLAALAIGQQRGEVRGDLPLDLLTTLIMGLGESMDRYFLGQLPDELSASSVDQLAGIYLDLMRRLAAP